MTRRLLGWAWLVPLPAMAMDVEAISRAIVNAGPWGRNPEFLPFLLGWLGITILVSLLLKLAYNRYDRWRTLYHAAQAARQHADEWTLELGRRLEVDPQQPLQPGEGSAAWLQYRQQIRQELDGRLRRSRDLAVELAQLKGE